MNSNVNAGELTASRAIVDNPWERIKKLEQEVAQLKADLAKLAELLKDAGVL